MLDLFYVFYQQFQFMHINNKKSTVSTPFVHDDGKQYHYKANQKDFSLIQTLQLIFEPTQIISTQLLNKNQQKPSKINEQKKFHGTKINRSHLLSQFSGGSNKQFFQNENSHKNKSFGQTGHSQKSQMKNSIINQFEPTKQAQGHRKQSPQIQKYVQKSRKIIRISKQTQQNYSTLKQDEQQQIRDSTMTFSPLRIDISLPSLCSEDFEEMEFKQEKKIINQIENDIKQLIDKIKTNHCNDEGYHNSSHGKKHGIPNQRFSKSRKY